MLSLAVTSVWSEAGRLDVPHTTPQTLNEKPVAEHRGDGAVETTPFLDMVQENLEHENLYVHQDTIRGNWR